MGQDIKDRKGRLVVEEAWKELLGNVGGEITRSSKGERTTSQPSAGSEALNEQHIVAVSTARKGTDGG
jgi:hypothetical protein